MPSVFRAVVPLLLLSSTGCLSVTHPARVRPGASVDLLATPERQEQRATTDSPSDSARVQLSGGYGVALAPHAALYVGGIVGATVDDALLMAVAPYAAVDVYLQAYGGQDAALDVGAGVLLSYYQGVYVLAGKAVGERVRIDGGVRALIGFDQVIADSQHGNDHAGPLRELTPHLMLSARMGSVRVAAYGEYAVYRLMDRTEIREGNEPDDSLVATTGGFAAGLVVGTPF